MRTPVTVIDFHRASYDDLIALYRHCLRNQGKLDHVYNDKTADNKMVVGDSFHFSRIVKDTIEKKGAKVDARNSRPAVQIVLSASPEYFRPNYQRDDPEGFGKYDQDRLDRWVEASVSWLTKTFGDDCVGAHLHVDERTPHIHAVIVPLVEKAPTMPRNKRGNETPENFERRVARAKKKKGTWAVSHHNYPAFAGKNSYERLVDSYAAEVSEIGIHRAERGSTATPTTKEKWARDLLADAKAKQKEAADNILSMQERHRIEEDSFEFGSRAVIDDKLRYGEATDDKAERLVTGANWPTDKESQNEIIERVRPAQSRVIAFAKFMRDLTTDGIEAGKKKVQDALRSVLKREAAVEAKEKELKEREKAIIILEDIDSVEINDGEIKRVDMDMMIEKNLISKPTEVLPPIKGGRINERGQRVR